MIEWTFVISSFVGGALSLAGVYLSEHQRQRREYKNWKRNNSTELIIEMIKYLELLNIPVAPLDNCENNSHLLKIDTNGVIKQIDNLAEFLDENAGRIKVFIPEKMSKELMHLRNELFIATQEQSVDCLNIRESRIGNAITHAHSISNELKGLL